MSDDNQISATLARHMAAARHHTPFGTMFPHDLRGLCRRTARIHGCTPDDVKRWMEGAA